MAGADGQAVNALTVPYVALSASMRSNGRVRLGDVGLAIRVATGAASSFLYADAGGSDSVSVGECSVNLVRALFGGSPTSEAVSFLVFPRTSLGNVAYPAEVRGLLQTALAGLAKFANAEEIVSRLAMTHLGDPLLAGRRFIPQTGFRRPLAKALVEEDDTITINAAHALRNAGFP